MRLSQNTSSKSKSLTIRHGKSTFRNDNDYKRSQKLFTPFIQRQLNQSKLQIYPDHYFINSWNIIFDLMTKTQIYILKIDNLAKNTQRYRSPNYNLEILLSLSKIYFEKLTSINFYRCDIVSIQSLSWFNFPHIKTINLTYNFINSYNSLAKCSFQIKDLYVYSEKNVNPNVQKLQRSKSKFNCVGFQYNALSSIICQDLSLIAKFNFYKVPYQRTQKTFKIGKKQRIQQLKVKKVLENFHNKINFHQNRSENRGANRRETGMRMEQRRNPSFMQMFANTMGYNEIASTINFYRQYFDSGNPSGVYDSNQEFDENYY